MLHITPEDGFHLGRVVLTGLSYTHYGAFADLSTVQALAMQVERQCPELMRHGIHLLISSALYNDRAVGSSHDYGQGAHLFNAGPIGNILLDPTHDIFGAKLRVVKCWQGIYGAKCRVSSSGAFSITRVNNRITAALMYSGIDVNVGPMLTHRHMDALADGTELLQWAPPASTPTTVPA